MATSRSLLAYTAPAYATPCPHRRPRLAALPRPVRPDAAAHRRRARRRRPKTPTEVAPLVFITTTGDRIQDRRLLEVGGKALFTKEIEEALLDGEIDCAVHSLKDVPAELPPGLVLAAYPEREDPRDAFVSLNYAGLDDLPQGARLGTASLRRQAQALRRRPDLQVELLRGNVDTRLRQAGGGRGRRHPAGRRRPQPAGPASLHPRATSTPIEARPPPGQGALAIETRAADVDAPWLEALRDRPTMLAIAAERGALVALEGSCRTAIGAHARIDGERLTLVVEALTADGRARWRREGEIVLAPTARPRPGRWARRWAARSATRRATA